MNILDERIKILIAFKLGKSLQTGSPGCWEDRDHDFINEIPCFESSTYRIKPKELEVWVNVYPDGTLFPHTIENKAAAALDPSGKTVRFIEASNVKN